MSSLYITPQNSVFDPASRKRQLENLAQGVLERKLSSSLPVEQITQGANKESILSLDDLNDKDVKEIKSQHSRQEKISSYNLSLFAFLPDKH